MWYNYLFTKVVKNNEIRKYFEENIFLPQNLFW